MADYELTIVLPGAASAAKKKSTKDLITKLVKMFKGKIVNEKEWGEKVLAYPIRKNSSGFFLYFDLELEGESVRALKDKLRLEEDLIRYLLVKKE